MNKETKGLYYLIWFLVLSLFFLLGLYFLYVGQTVPAVIILLSSLGNLHLVLKNKNKR